MLRRLSSFAWRKTNGYRLHSSLKIKTGTSSFSTSYLITCEELDEYNRTGVFVKRRLFDQEEIDILKQTIECDALLQEHEYTLSDNEGGRASMVIWDYLSDDSYGNMLQSERMINIVEKLLAANSSSEICHYHSKCVYMTVHAQ